MTKKLLLLTFHCSLITVTCLAAVPLRWTVETSRVQPAVFEAYHGEALALDATLQSYGKPLAISSDDWKIYWQTNGMGAAYWSAPAGVANGNHVTATFTPEMDPGAAIINGFIGQAGSNYRASFTVRFRGSPGANPAVLELPRRELDYATTVVKNPPYYAKTEVDTLLEQLRLLMPETVREIVTRAYVESLGISGGSGGIAVETDPKFTAWLDEGYVNAYSVEIGDTLLTQAGGRLLFYTPDGGIIMPEPSQKEGGSTLARLSDIPNDDISNAYLWSRNVYEYMTANTNAWFAATNYVTNAEIAAARHKFAFDEGMDLTTVPSSMALMEIRDGEKVCVWDQRDWTSWYVDFKKRQIDAELDRKASKAWARSTARGEDNPDDSILWIDTPKVILSAGYSWQKQATASGSFFVLKYTGMHQVGDHTEGSFFEIKDDEGKSLFKISKTDSYLADADASSVHAEDETLVVTYPAGVSAHPIFYCCTDLAAADFVAEDSPDCPCTVSWSGGSGAWTVRVTPRNPSGRCFGFAKVMVEGETKAQFAAPVELQKIVIGNTVYTVNTTVINGKTVLTLER